MRNITRILGVTASLILLLSLSGCYYDDIIEEVIPPNTDISFATDIQPIFNANCVACHNGSLNPDLRDGNAYSSLMALPVGSIVPGDAEGSELFEMLNGGGDNPMPPGGSIPSSQIALFAQWINQGALNN